MSKDDKPTELEPRLRFPEFRDAGQWPEAAVKSLANVTAGQSPAGKYYNDVGDGMPFYQGRTDFGEITINPPTKWTTEVTKVAEAGDIMMSVRAPVGDVNVSDRQLCIGRGLASIRAKQDGRFLFYLLDRMNRRFIGNGGSIFDSINKAQIENTLLWRPPTPDEQRKIAECLGSLDDLIAAETGALAALRQHKTGLMQLLFPRPGEARPRLRFPEFRDADEWKSGRCHDIATVLQGYGFPEKYQGQSVGDYPFYKVSDISLAVKMGRRYIAEAKNYIDDNVLKDLRARPVPAGTVIFAKIGEAIRSDRRVVTTKPAVIDNNTAGVKARKGKSSDGFLFYLWSNVSLIDHAGGVVPAVSKSSLENVPLTYPTVKAEQDRIADCLASLDTMIAAQAEKLGGLRTHKRGLMQQLFPVADGIEGGG